MDEFDEYRAQEVMQACLPQLLPSSGEINTLHRAYKKASEAAEQRKTLQRLFEAVIARWVAGEVVAEGIQSWDEFCARVESGLMQVVRNTPSAASAIVFTSAGPIGAAMRRALHLSAADTLQLTWMSHNASFSTFLASGERFTLSAFNAHPHLDGDGLLTYR
jgi:broad specificity phosphatase PhoE